MNIDMNKKERQAIDFLRSMERDEHPCGSGADYRSLTFYCDDCPIGSFGTNTCTKKQQYSK